MDDSPELSEVQLWTAVAAEQSPRRAELQRELTVAAYRDAASPGQEAAAVFAAANMTFAAVTEPGPTVITDLDSQELTTVGAGANGLLSEAALSAGEITGAKQYRGSASGLYLRAGLPQKAETSPCTSSKSPPRIPHPAKTPRRTWSPPNV